MSDAVVDDEESILNEGNSAEEPIDLDDEAIAELLGDKIAPDITDNNVNDNGIVSEDVQIDEVVLESDEEIVEEIVLPQESNGTRKRSFASTSATVSPKRKRSRPASIYLATRKSVTNFIAKLLGSYDRMLQVKNMHQYIGMINFVGKKVEHEYVAKHKGIKEVLLLENFEFLEYTTRIADLEKENQDLRKELETEKGAKEALAKSLLEFREEMIVLNKHIKSIQTSLPMPTTPEITDCLFGRKMTELSQAQIVQHVEPPVRPQSHLVPYSMVQRQRILQNMQPMQRHNIQKILPPAAQPHRRQTAHPSQLRDLIQAQNQEPRRSLPIPPHRIPRAPAWDSLPIPTITNAGHMMPCTLGPWELIDTTVPNSKLIITGIPLIPIDRIIPIYDDDTPAWINMPARFDSLVPNPDVEVVIKSTDRDFRENWQIGGKISYDKLPRVESKVSFKKIEKDVNALKMRNVFFAVYPTLRTSRLIKIQSAHRKNRPSRRRVHRLGRLETVGLSATNSSFSHNVPQKSVDSAS